MSDARADEDVIEPGKPLDSAYRTATAVTITNGAITNGSSTAIAPREPHSGHLSGQPLLEGHGAAGRRRPRTLLLGTLQRRSGIATARKRSRGLAVPSLPPLGLGARPAAQAPGSQPLQEDAELLTPALGCRSSQKLPCDRAQVGDAQDVADQPSTKGVKAEALHLDSPPGRRKAWRCQRPGHAAAADPERGEPCAVEREQGLSLESKFKVRDAAPNATEPCPKLLSATKHAGGVD
jgi:hypothetical protein